MINKKEESTELLEQIVHSIAEKKGDEIVSLDLRKINECITDYFVICHGNSNTQVNAIADSVRQNVKETLDVIPIYEEGKQNAEWVILDYGDIVVHVFQREIREHYGLEDLWHDAKRREHAEQNEINSIVNE